MIDPSAIRRDNLRISCAETWVLARTALIMIVAWFIWFPILAVAAFLHFITLLMRIIYYSVSIQLSRFSLFRHRNEVLPLHVARRLLPRAIAITGASSGIGAALAMAYAAPNVVLLLTARSRDKLEAIADACRQRGAEVYTEIVDVADEKRMREALLAMDDKYEIDLVIANAGTTGDMVRAIDNCLDEKSPVSSSSNQSPPKEGGMTFAEVQRAVFMTNLTGALNTVLPFVDRMTARRRGQLVFIGSLMSFASFPPVAMYGMTKHALLAYGADLRAVLRPSCVSVCVVCPGFVESAIVRRNRELGLLMPLTWPAERAANYIRDALRDDVGVIAFPAVMHVLAALMPIIPTYLLDRLYATTRVTANLRMNRFG